MLSTVPHSGKLGRFFVTLLQFFPPSRVTCTCPSLVPAQSSPASFGDSVSAKITPAYSTPILSGVRPPEICWRLLSLRVRSGLMICQLLPPSLLPEKPPNCRLLLGPRHEGPSCRLP